VARIEAGPEDAPLVECAIRRIRPTVPGSFCPDRRPSRSGRPGQLGGLGVTRYLKNRRDPASRQIVFEGERLDMQAVWKVRDRFFPPGRGRA
jgi:hypothetical protein